MKPRPVRTVADALWEEFTAIHGEPAPTITVHKPDALLDAYYNAALDKEQAALCLSGGGIRSASFCLGVLQALARRRLLTKFHYLSTVSGGGYIGGWLTSLIHVNNGDVAAVQSKLAEAKPLPEIENLRHFTNFLTPEPGLASTDTWAGLILWLRNVLINWMLFVPGLFALPLAPLLYRDLIESLSPAFGLLLLLVGYVCLWTGVYFGARHLPSHAPSSDRMAPGAVRRGAPFAVRWVVVPILAWAAIVPLIAAPSLRLVMPDGTVPLALIPIGGFVVMVVAYLAAGAVSGKEHWRLFRRNFFWWAAAALVASIFLYVGLSLGQGATPAVIAVLGPLWVTVAHLMQSLFYVALRREAFRGDLDREWLARLSARKVVPALLWALFAAICLLLPILIFQQWSSRTEPWIVGAIGVLSGPGAALLGKSAATAAGGDGKQGTTVMRLPLDVVVAIFTAVFAILLFMVLAWAGDSLTDAFAPRGSAPDAAIPSYRWSVDLLFLLAAFGLAYKLGQRINVNRFSMHAVYRVRLVRAFLGSAREDRRPDAFTDIDPHDNPRMSEVFGKSRPLFPVVNVTLNLTASHNTAWAERKAESFAITPLACGAADLHRVEDTNAGKPVRGAYVTTSAYAGVEKETGRDDPGLGITLGTAVAISGAAVSPNMGYNSSPATAFLMTLFNVRLGAWLPNPAVASTKELLQAKPPNALFTLAREMLGLTNDTGPAVYLSDGGHFDDLGLYEMIRRRCRHIVVVDAGQDPDSSFGDLGNAARKVFIDFGVRINFRPTMKIGSRLVPIEPIRGYAYADIVYPNEQRLGKLIYLKPCDLPDAPIDVRAFRNANGLFPHETTLNQWFSESRFESYRGLGDAEMSDLGLPEGAPGWDSQTLDQFCDEVHRQLQVGAAACHHNAEVVKGGA